MLLQENPLTTSISVSQAVEDIKSLTRPGQVQDNTSLLSLGRALLARRDPTKQSSAAPTFSAHDQETLEHVLGHLSSQDHTEAASAAQAAARYYVQVCRNCTELDSNSELDDMQKQVAEVQSRADEAARQLRAALDRLVSGKS